MAPGCFGVLVGPSADDPQDSDPAVRSLNATVLRLACARHVVNVAGAAGAQE